MTFFFLSNMKAEIMKIRRTHALWLTVGGAGFIPLINFLKLVGRPDIFLPRLPDNPWTSFIHENWAPAASFLLPVYVILLISLIAQIEYGNKTWKLVYTSPRSHADIFISKFFVVNLLVLACFILFTVFIQLSGYAVWVINHEYHFTTYPTPWTHIMMVSAKMYLSVLGIMGIQFSLSLHAPNYLTPLGVGMALLIGGFMIRQWEHITYYPYMHPILVYFENPGLDNNTADKAIVNAVLVSVLSLAAGFYHMCVRKQLA